MAGLVLIPGRLPEGRATPSVEARSVRTVAKPRGAAPRETQREPQVSAGPLRMTRRGRAVLVTLAIAAGLVLGFLGGRVEAAASADAQLPAQVVVEDGDTLWGFAAEVAQPGEDVRDVVLALQRLNGLPTADLVPGDVLLLPAD